jgi:hypothetical protein
MGDTWFVNLQHVLDEDGAIAAPKGPARNLAEHIVKIVAMASRPEIIPLPEYQVSCRRRPGRKPCTGIIEADYDPDTYDIMWWCPVCDDDGSTIEPSLRQAALVVTVKCSGALRKKVNGRR